MNTPVASRTRRWSWLSFVIGFAAAPLVIGGLLVAGAPLLGPIATDHFGQRMAQFTAATDSTGMVMGIASVNIAARDSSFAHEAKVWLVGRSVAPQFTSLTVVDVVRGKDGQLHTYLPTVQGST
jgi:hypothetical protein